MLEDPMVRDFLVRFAVKMAATYLPILVRKVVRFIRAKNRRQK